MIARSSRAQVLSGQVLSGQGLSRQTLPRTALVAALLALGLGLSGCSSTSIADLKDDMSLDAATLAFVDPAKYDYYDCKQLEAERKSLTGQIEGTKALMAKADTGFAGPVVAELAYRNNYVAAVGQKKLADQTWRHLKCRETPPDPLGATAAGPAPADMKGKRGPSRSGNAVY
jgi:hypothetical protein